MKPKHKKKEKLTKFIVVDENSKKVTSFNAILGGVIFLLISLIAFTVMIRTSKRLSWKEGTLLLFIYILFIVTQIYIKG